METVRLKGLGITTKFILWFLFIALVPLAVATYISYQRSRAILEEEIANSLRAVADNKLNQVETFLFQKMEDVTDLSPRAEIIDAMEKFSRAHTADPSFNSSDYIKADDEYRPYFYYFQKSRDYENFLLVNPEGHIVFSVGEIRDRRSLYEIILNEGSELADAFIKTKESLKTEISDFEYNSRTQKASVFFAAPVFKEADFIGAVILEMSNRGLFKFVQDYRGLGKTGETLLASKVGDEAVIIAPLRFDPDAAFRKRVAFGAKLAIPVQKAVKGESGEGVFRDYRGQKVLSDIRYLEQFRLGMVVKMNTREILASADKLKNTLLLVSMILLAMVVLMAVVIARSISSPIKELTNTSSIITGGDFSARADIAAKDEIGELAHSFNEMTDKLVKAKASVEYQKEELEEQKKLLEKVNKELDSFVYTASHDLRAPLRGISSFASFLEEDYKDKLNEEGKDYLKEIREGASRMNDLIEDLLKLSRISRIKNPYEEVDMNAFLASVIKQLEFDVKDKKVDLRVQKDLPVVSCDRIKGNEVFLNLINNAIKFSSKNNKERPRVEVGYAEEGDYHRFYVKDNGIGIDPKYHDEIFGIFRRLHTSDEYEGTGAGLSIVKKIIDDHGGRIWIESKAGEGATFYFTIPKTLRKKETGKVIVDEVLMSKERPEDSPKAREDPDLKKRG